MIQTFVPLPGEYSETDTLSERRRRKRKESDRELGEKERTVIVIQIDIRDESEANDAIVEYIDIDSVLMKGRRQATSPETRKSRQIS